MSAAVDPGASSPGDPEARFRALQIEGGVPLRGRVKISGSKNAALPIMAAALLSRDACRLTNVPRVADVENMAAILEEIGVKVERERLHGDRLTLTAAGSISSDVPQERARRMRASILFMGPLLARTGRAVLPKPGGDDIGMRRVDQHVFGLVQMGAKVEEQEGLFICTARRLKGAEIQLDVPTVTGTENLLMAAVTAEGRTTIRNAAREPHVEDLCRALVRMGAQIGGLGTDRIEIRGVDELQGLTHHIISDYLEAGTYAIAAAATNGQVAMIDCPIGDLRGLILKLRAAGVVIEIGEGRVEVRRGPHLRAIDLTTCYHPGIATDLQPQYTALMTQAEGTAVVQEFLFEDRFKHIPGLNALGASIDLHPHGRSVAVHGPSPLTGTPLSVPDIRSGAALLIGGLAAGGLTRIDRVDRLERGYEDFAGKLSGLGARLKEIAA